MQRCATAIFLLIAHTLAAAQDLPVIVRQVDGFNTRDLAGKLEYDSATDQIDVGVDLNAQDIDAQDINVLDIIADSLTATTVTTDYFTLNATTVDGAPLLANGTGGDAVWGDAALADLIAAGVTLADVGDNSTTAESQKFEMGGNDVEFTEGGGTLLQLHQADAGELTNLLVAISGQFDTQGDVPAVRFNDAQTTESNYMLLGDSNAFWITLDSDRDRTVQTGALPFGGYDDGVLARFNDDLTAELFGTLTVPDLKIDDATAGTGKVWTATDADGNGEWSSVPTPATDTLADVAGASTTEAENTYDIADNMPVWFRNRDVSSQDAQIRLSQDDSSLTTSNRMGGIEFWSEDSTLTSNVSAAIYGLADSLHQSTNSRPSRIELWTAGVSADPRRVFWVDRNALAHLEGQQFTFHADDTNKYNLIAPTISGLVNFTLPNSGGSSGQFLTTNGSGTTSWADVSSGLDADLTAIAALASTGIAVRTGTNTWAQRTITGDSEAVVTNGNGVSGNPTLSIGSAITRDSEWDTLAEIESVLGYDFSSGSNIDTGTIAAARIADAYLLNTGDTMNGNLVVSGGTLTAPGLLMTTGYLKNTLDDSSERYIHLDFSGISTANGQVRFFRTTNSTGYKFVRFYMGDGTTGYSHQIGMGSLDTFFNANAISGQFGVGTNSPVVTLNVNGDGGAPAASGTAATAIMRLESDAGFGNVMDFGTYEASPFGVWMQGNAEGNLATNYPFIINPKGGFVGVGESAPKGTLHAKSASAGTWTVDSSADDLIVENSGTGGMTIATPASTTGFILFARPSNSAIGRIQYSHASDEMSLWTNNTQIMSLDSSSVGISSDAVDILPNIGGSSNFTFLNIDDGSNAIGMGVDYSGAETAGWTGSTENFNFAVRRNDVNQLLFTSDGTRYDPGADATNEVRTVYRQGSVSTTAANVGSLIALDSSGTAPVFFLKLKFSLGESGGGSAGEKLYKAVITTGPTWALTEIVENSSMNGAADVDLVASGDSGVFVNARSSAAAGNLTAYVTVIRSEV